MVPAIGYGADTNLAQLVFDLSLWSHLGGAKNATSIPLRVAMSGVPFSPEYWKLRHLALVDLQRQIGWPTLFITVSPYEWSAPYHAWLEHELQAALRSRTHLPVAETFHLSHVLTQLVVSMLCGHNSKNENRTTLSSLTPQG